METKDSSGKKGEQVDLSWKIPDPSQGQKKSAAQSKDQTSAQTPDAASGAENSSTDGAPSLELRRTSRRLALTLGFLSLLLAGGGTLALIYLRRPDLIPEKIRAKDIPAVTSRWIDDKTALARFSTEWTKARVVTLKEVNEFALRFWTFHSAYLKNPYGAEFSNIEDRKTALLKEFGGGDLIAIELPFESFFSGEVSINTDRYVVKLTSGERTTGDGGYLQLRSLLSVKLPVSISKSALTPSQPAPALIRILISPYHLEPQFESKSVRPMELPLAGRRFDAINPYVELTEADVVIAADIMGIAALDSSGKLLVAKMKGYVIPG